MKTPHFSDAVFFLAIFGALAASSLGQGDLNPPPGPPAPTMKSLDQVEPRILLSASNTPGDAASTFIISAPGSYYLTGNFNGEPGKHGISIQANDVTLDLNGFALISGGGGATRGVDIPAAQNGTRIRNGSVRGWTGDGIHGQAGTMLAEKLALTDSTGAIGLAVGLGSMVKDCVATDNATGFSLPDRSQASNCIATVNTGVGFNCTSYVNIIDCTSSRNGSDGIVVGSSSSVRRCNSSRNISLGGSLGGNGILAGSGCTIADCEASANTFDGIRMSAASTGGIIRNCSAQANGGSGISVQNSCFVLGSTCDANSNGILTNADGSRIDGNSCTANTNRDFSILGSQNLVIRNSARGNSTPFFIPFTNRAGPIEYWNSDSEVTTNSPWANFAY